jgi:hypothetical protein
MVNPATYVARKPLTQPRRALVGEEHERDRQHRIQAVVFEMKPVDEGDGAAGQHHARDEPHAHLHDEQADQIDNATTCPLNQADHLDGQEDGCWVVATRLQFE